MRIIGPRWPSSLALGRVREQQAAPTSGDFEDCYYDCKPGQKQASTTARSSAGTTPATPAPGGKLTPAGEKAQGLREAADLLDKAQAALDERQQGPRRPAVLDGRTARRARTRSRRSPTTFRAGAPPRVAGADQEVRHLGAAAAESDRQLGAEDAEAKVPPPRIEGSLTGVVEIDGKPLSGAYGLVTLEPASGKWAPRTPKHRVVEQRNREFLPHVLAVPVGSTVAFPNFDNVFHNVFSTSPLARVRPRHLQDRRGARVHVHEGRHHPARLQPARGDVGVHRRGRRAGVRRHRRQRPLRVQAPRAGQVQAARVERADESPITQDVTVKAGANEIKVGVAADAPAGAQPDKFGGKRG